MIEIKSKEVELMEENQKLKKELEDLIKELDKISNLSIVSEKIIKLHEFVEKLKEKKWNQI